MKVSEEVIIAWLDKEIKLSKGLDLPQYTMGLKQAKDVIRAEFSTIRTKKQLKSVRF